MFGFLKRILGGADAPKAAPATRAAVVEIRAEDLDDPARLGPKLAAVARLCIQRRIACEVSLEERMACGIGVCMGCAVPMAVGGYTRACREGPVYDVRAVKWE